MRPSVARVGREADYSGMARLRCHVVRCAAKVSYRMGWLRCHVVRCAAKVGSLALLLAACAQAPVRTPALAPSLRLAPAALGAEVALQQRLTVTHGTRTQHADALLEIDARSLRLALLAGPKRLLTLAFDGERIEEQRYPDLPGELAGERFIDDIQLAYWPADAIRAALPAGWTLRDDVLTRSLLHLGQLVTEVRYAGEVRWLGRIEILHAGADARLRIESVPAR